MLRAILSFALGFGLGAIGSISSLAFYGVMLEKKKKKPVYIVLTDLIDRSTQVDGVFTSRSKAFEWASRPFTDPLYVERDVVEVEIDV